MIPTFLFMLAFVGIGIAGPEFDLEEFVLEEMEPDGPAGVTLRISRSEFFENQEAYKIEHDRSNLNGGFSSSGVEKVNFKLDSFPPGRVKYTGTLETTAPKQLLLTMELENEVPFRLSVEGLNEVTAQEGDQPLSLGEMLPPGTHSIRITGVAPPPKKKSSSRPTASRPPKPTNATSSKSEPRPKPNTVNRMPAAKHTSSSQREPERKKTDRIRTLSSLEQKAIEEAERTSRPLTNGNFSKGFEGWNIEGGAAAFRTFGRGGRRSLTTFGDHRKADTGRLFQCFKVPEDAARLTFKLHGGANREKTYVAIWHKNSRHGQMAAKNDNTPFQAHFQLTAVRDEVVTLEIVDNSTDPWGFIGVENFRIVNETELNRRKANVQQQK